MARVGFNDSVRSPPRVYLHVRAAGTTAHLASDCLAIRPFFTRGMALANRYNFIGNNRIRNLVAALRERVGLDILAPFLWRGALTWPIEPMCAIAGSAHDERRDK